MSYGYPLDIHGAQTITVPNPAVRGYPYPRTHGQKCAPYPCPTGSGIHGYPDPWIKLTSLFPSFMSMTAPTVRRKGRPKIIGQEGSHSMSITMKSTGT